jgi:dTDP-4-amino-4,6-dideoxygalactose transaminase
VNLPPGSFKTLIRSILGGNRQEAIIEKFYREFAHWLGASHSLGTSSGRSAFQLALQALGMKKGAEVIFPMFTFPVIPLVAKLLGYQPVFCDVNPETYNSDSEHIAPKITENTGAILATHLFGRPCAIREIADMAHQQNIRLLEDCAHACGVRVDGRQVGTFGDIGVFSFAEGKNMPCFGGGAIATSDDKIAQRARQILSEAPVPSRDTITKTAVSVWSKWLLTRPFIFGLTVFPALRLKLLLGQPLMDSVGGDELLEAFKNSTPQIGRMNHLQAAEGLLQLNHIDTFNEGARRNARILTDELGEVPGIGAPETLEGDHIFVYYPLRVEPEKRDNLRHYLLKHGFDSKISDMYDCRALKLFQASEERQKSQNARMEASILEICVYPVIAQAEMRRLARKIRAWAGLSANQRPPAKPGG